MPPVAGTLGPEVRGEVDLLVEVVNESYPDTVRFLASWRAGREVRQARIVGVDPAGADVDVDGAAGEGTLRVAFPEPVTDAGQVRAQLLARIARARADAPDRPLTSLERAYADAAAQRMHRCTVRDVVDLTPRLRQLSVGPLDGFVARGTDQAVTLMVPTPGRPVPDGLTWPQLQELPDDERPHGATYTIRRWHPVDQTADVWVVRHGDHGISGWAGQATVGDELVLWGPRGGHVDVPADTTRLLLVCDETALGAVAATIDDTDPAVPVHVVAEVDDGRHTVDLPGGARTTVTWVLRGGDEPGTGTRLLDTVRDLDLRAEGLFAFGAAEAGCIMPVRRHLRRVVGLDRDHVHMGGYWKRAP